MPPPDAYTKLAFTIGKGLDLKIIYNEGWLSAAATAMYLVDEKTEIGGRFATVYRTHGDEMAEAPPEEEGGDCWLGQIYKGAPQEVWHRKRRKDVQCV